MHCDLHMKWLCDFSMGVKVSSGVRVGKIARMMLLFSHTKERILRGRKGIQ